MLRSGEVAERQPVGGKLLGAKALGSALVLVMATGAIYFWEVARGEQLLLLGGQTMGTTYRVKYRPHQESPSLDEVRSRVEDRLLAVNQALSTYLRGSELSRINRGAGGETYQVGPLVRKALRLNWQVFKQSEGFFDPSIGPLVNLWGFGPQGRRRAPPSQQAIARALGWVGLEKFYLSPDFWQLRKPRGESYLDFSASAKGLGVDEVSELLDSLGVVRYMVEIGGEIRVRSRGKQRWNLGIESPLAKGNSAVQTFLSLANGALATSGNYRNYFEQNGRLYGHTIDPHTGESVVSSLLSASVVHDNCALADAWATALLAMGERRGMAVAKQLKLKVLLLVSNGDGGLRELPSPQWAREVVR